MSEPTPEQVEAARAEYDRSEDMCAALVAAAGAAPQEPPVDLALDVWHALGLPDSEFDAYYQRNGWADTWSNLLYSRGGVSRRVECGADANGEPCVLRSGVHLVHYGASDVGSSEALPQAEAEDHAATVTGDREKLIADALEGAALRITADDDASDRTNAEAEARAGGFNDAMAIVEPYVQQIAALAAPVEVDEAKLSRLIERHSCATLAAEGRRVDQETICAECGWAFSIRADRTSPDQETRRKFDHVAHVVAEWLRGGGQ